MAIKWKKVDYQQLNSRQRENYNCYQARQPAVVEQKVNEVFLFVHF